MTIVEKHIREIKVGDTVIHEGVERTVCKKDIGYGFYGKMIFGNSYRMGTIPVQVVVY